MSVVWRGEDDERHLNCGTVAHLHLAHGHVVRHAQVHQAPVVQRVLGLGDAHVRICRFDPLDHAYAAQNGPHHAQKRLLKPPPAAVVFLVIEHDCWSEERHALGHVGLHLHCPTHDQSTHGSTHDEDRRCRSSFLPTAQVATTLLIRGAIRVRLLDELGELNHVPCEVVHIAGVAPQALSPLTLAVALQVEGMYITTNLIQPVGNAPFVLVMPVGSGMRRLKALVAGMHTVPVHYHDNGRGARPFLLITSHAFVPVLRFSVLLLGNRRGRLVVCREDFVHERIGPPRVRA
mmetsp:Transcript_3753/g.9505  ORF Transcript_3753/g.9505 Transcript_3753/m.9505 type:complete len:290 (+) Transcript_3753:1120-1989(+)